MQAASSTFCRGATPFQAVKAQRQQQQQRPGSLVVRASRLAEPAALPVKTLTGSDAGQASIALRVAEEDTATGLVHRYLTTVLRNARQVGHKRTGRRLQAIGPPCSRRGWWGGGERRRLRRPAAELRAQTQSAMPAAGHG